MNDKINNPKAIARQLKESLKEILQSSECFYSSIKDITFTKDYNLGEIAQKHSNAAIELWNIRETYLSILTDIKADTLTIEQIKEKRDKAQEKLINIYKGAPRTISKAYNEASKALKINEELTFSDHEIDNLLPNELRKNIKLS